jgi:hypothetical protein
MGKLKMKITFNISTLSFANMVQIFSENELMSCLKVLAQFNTKPTIMLPLFHRINNVSI